MHSYLPTHVCPSGTPRTRYIGSNEAEGQTSWDRGSGILGCHSKKQHAASYAGASDGCQSLFFFWVLLIIKLLKTCGCFPAINVYGQLWSDCRWIMFIASHFRPLYNPQCHRDRGATGANVGCVIKVLKASVFELGKSDLSFEANSCSDKFF